MLKLRIFENRILISITLAFCLLFSSGCLNQASHKTPETGFPEAKQLTVTESVNEDETITLTGVPQQPETTTDPGEIGQLIETLKNSTDPLVRSNALEALFLIKDDRVIEPIISALKDKDTNIRDRAAQILGTLKDPRAIEPLIAAFSDEEIEGDVEVALTDIGKPATAPLIAALKNENSSIRASAAWTLGGIMDPISVEPLITALGDEDPSIREGAAEALGQIRDARAVEPLITALQDKSTMVQQNAGWSLGEIRDERSIEALKEALISKNLEVVRGAYRFFIELGEKDSEDTLIGALNLRGTKYMAEAYLNSGNGSLESGAQNWASENGYTVVHQDPGRDYSQWGSSQ